MVGINVGTKVGTGVGELDALALESTVVALNIPGFTPLSSSRVGDPQSTRRFRCRSRKIDDGELKVAAFDAWDTFSMASILSVSERSPRLIYSLL